MFDAVSALLGIRPRVSYEAQAAIEMEMAASRWSSNLAPEDIPPTYPFDLVDSGDGSIIRLQSLVQAILQDLEGGLDPAEIGWRFHYSLAHMIATICRQIAAQTGSRTVALSGGCFQNRLLLELVLPRLEQYGFRTLLHHQVPCNDGGVSLGQAALARFAVQDWKGNNEVH